MRGSGARSRPASRTFLPPPGQTADSDGRQETFAAVCLTLTNHARVKVVALKKAEIEGGLLLLVTNTKHWLPQTVILAYTQRALGEAFYRDGKQNLGLEACMIRDHVASVGEMCQRTVTDTARLFPVWAMKWVNRRCDPTTTVSLAFMSRRRLRAVPTP